MPARAILIVRVCAALAVATAMLAVGMTFNESPWRFVVVEIGIGVGSSPWLWPVRSRSRPDDQTEDYEAGIAFPAVPNGMGSSDAGKTGKQ